MYKRLKNIINVDGSSIYVRVTKNTIRAKKAGETAGKQFFKLFGKK